VIGAAGQLGELNQFAATADTLTARRAAPKCEGGDRELFIV